METRIQNGIGVRPVSGRAGCVDPVFEDFKDAAPIERAAPGTSG